MKVLVLSGVLAVSMVISLTTTLRGETEKVVVPAFRYDFYRDSCPEAENIVRSSMNNIFFHNNASAAHLLRLLFHDCFIEGCDASVLLDASNSSGDSTVERLAIPNRTLKGFQSIDMIKEELEKVCPGVVSCSDVLVIATRDAIVSSGGPYYPVFTGRRDRNGSFFSRATADIPRPNGNISETLRLFALRGFDERETVALLGGHNIGHISCEFIKPRLDDFMGTGLPDPSISSDFLEELRHSCGETHTNFRNRVLSLRLRGKIQAAKDRTMSYMQDLSSSIPSGDAFGTNYFQSLVRGRGLLFADQQLMENELTAKAVLDYASDDGTKFRTDFARVMVKLSNLGVLTGFEGQVRRNCSKSESSS